MKPPRNLIRQLPNLDTLAQQLNEAPHALLERAFPTQPGALSGVDSFVPKAVDSASEPEGGTAALGIGGTLLRELESSAAEVRQRLLVDVGARAVAKLRAEGEDADLEPDEALALEAIVLVEGRPALLIQEGRFFPPPAEWSQLEAAREAIEQTCRSVGRVEVEGHPELDWIGTGFLVADDVVMTNRHVAQEFSVKGSRKRWSFATGMTARIDYVEELSALTPAEFALTRVIGVHETFDLALLEVEQVAGDIAAPAALPVASQAPETAQGRLVYAIGYPAWDGRRNDPEIMRRIFSDIFNVKRLQPGTIVDISDEHSLFIHDCSTLGGNSGSCVVDLETHQVLGLHYSGRYLQGNLAIALWNLTDDRLIKKAKLNYA